MKLISALLLGIASTIAVGGAQAQSLPGNVIRTGGAGFGISDWETSSSSIVIDDVFENLLSWGNNVVVRMNGLNHSYASDIFAWLTYTPDVGPSITEEIFPSACTGCGFNATFSFGDAFSGSFPYGGPDVQAWGNFQNFNGVDANGTWTLSVHDAVGGDQGGMESWDIGLRTVSSGAVPEPATLVLFASGLAGLALVRRLRSKA